MSGIAYIFSFAWQLYFLIFTMMQCSLADLLFCSWIQFSVSQLHHLKDILTPLIQLSSTLDTYRPNSANLFASSEKEKDILAIEGRISLIL